MDKTQDQLDQDKRLAENLSRIKHTIIVLSGKGGVGKTTVSIHLAYSLALKGNNVGILDIDLHGPNIATMLGVEGAAADFKVPFLGRIPLEPEMVLHGDAGTPFIHHKKETDPANALNGIVKKVIAFINDSSADNA